MASLPPVSTTPQNRPESIIHIEQQTSESTETATFIPGEDVALPSWKETGERANPSGIPMDYNSRTPISPNDVTTESTASIVAGLVAGIILAIGHHLFLTFLNGQNIDEYPQYWVKNANNAFSALFAICNTFAASCALVQVKWKVAGGKPLSIKTIDNLFALPSPLALFTTARSTRLWSLKLFLLPVSTAIFIQSLALISVFAPNALTVARSAEISRNITASTILIAGYGFMRDMWMVPSTSYVGADPDTAALLTSVMLQPPLTKWKIPKECGATCKFDIVYESPGLQCTDTSSEPAPYTGDEVYNATSSLYPLSINGSSPSWEIENQYDMRISYNVLKVKGSVDCVFRNATYKASFQVENNTMQVNHGIQSYGNILGGIHYGDRDAQCSDVSSYDRCARIAVNMRVMCEVFASTFTGTRIKHYSGTTNITGGINAPLITLLWNDEPRYFTDVSQMSKRLVDLFSKLTLGLIPYRGRTEMVQATLWDGSYAWSYTVWILWAVYLPTLILASLVAISGLLSIRSNKRGMDDKFSTFLLTTRRAELNDICMGAADFDELQKSQLVYQGGGSFAVASGRTDESLI